IICCFFFFQAEDGIRDYKVTGVQTCALPIWAPQPLQSPNLDDAPREFRHFISRCCEDKPESRYPDAGEALAAFEVLTATSREGRSEERRVGKEGRWRRGREAEREKNKGDRCT